MKAAFVAAVMGAVVLASAAGAYEVGFVKGNDTGGIISYSLVGQTDIRALAFNHCAQYNKVAKLTGTQAYYGGYISFACKWVPVGRYDRPIRTRY